MHRGSEFSENCFARTACAEKEGLPDADRVVARISICGRYCRVSTLKQANEGESLDVQDVAAATLVDEGLQRRA